MTTHDLQRLLPFNGMWLIGDRRFHNACQPVVVLGNESGCGVAHAMQVGHALSDEPAHWHESTFIMGGPYTRQTIEDLDRKAELVAEEVALLDHDIQFWRDMVRRMKPFVANAANDEDMESPDREYAKCILDDLKSAVENEPPPVNP